MLRFILLSILLTIIDRAVSRLWSGVVRGMQGGVDQSYEAPRPRGARMPQHGVQMVRDPFCGTFVVPERAVAFSGSHGEPLHFCSTSCRDQYIASRRAPSAVHTRTA